MAAEAYSQAYLFRPPMLELFTTQADPPAWRHNPLHDLESVWWVAVWCVHYFVLKEERQNDKPYPGRFFALFPSTDSDFSEHILALTADGRYADFKPLTNQELDEHLIA